MSSPSDRAEPAPTSSAESTASLEPARSAAQPSATAPETAAPEHTTPEAEQRRKASGIRIGTQRYGVKPPPAVPKPVLAAHPSSLLVKSPPAHPSHEPQRAPEPAHPETTATLTENATSPATASPAEMLAAPDQTAAAYVEAASTEAASTEAAPVEEPATREPRAHGKKPRDSKPRGPRFIADPPRPAKVEPPSTRGQLSPELELEYMEALGEQPLDEIISTGTSGAAAIELEPESRHKAKVVSVHRDNVFVEIGGAQQGVIQLKNFAKPPEPGAVLDVMVGRFNASEGLYELMLPGGTIDVGDWSEVSEDMVVEARVTGHNKGGLECEVNKLRGFIPASQISMYRVEDLAQFVDQKFACVVTEANPEKRNLVLSHRAVLERDKAEAKQKLMSELEVGQTREATVRSLQNFGAFVDLGGVDGLIHISQLSWDRIKHASEVLEVGQKVKVKIQKIDPQTGKIGLAFRDLSENPWANAARDFPARSRVKGTVSRLMEFGAFVRLGPGVEGLIHISELSHKRIFRVSDVLQEGQEVDVQVQSVDPEQQRISLSLKALEARATPAPKAEDLEPDVPETPSAPPKKRTVPLKGGTGGPSTGEKFGLKW